MFPNRRDFLAIVKRLSALPLFLKVNNGAGFQTASSAPQAPVGPSPEDVNWQLARQAQQKMSDYVQETLKSMNANSHGASISNDPNPLPKNYVPSALLWGEEEDLEGATHEDFP